MAIECHLNVVFSSSLREVEISALWESQVIYNSSLGNIILYSITEDRHYKDKIVGDFNNSCVGLASTCMPGCLALLRVSDFVILFLVSL